MTLAMQDGNFVEAGRRSEITGYMRALRIALGDQISKRAAIYLDTKYWIYLRDAELGRPQHAAHPALLADIRKLVRDERAFCPVSAPTILELLKQTVPESRETMASLVDELSLSIGLCSEEERAATEVAHLMYRYSGRDLHPLSHLVWVKLPLVFGQPAWRLDQLSTEQAEKFSRAMIDALWQGKLSDLLPRWESPEFRSQTFESLAAKLNQGNTAHADEMKTFASVYLDEISGVLDLVAHVGGEVIEKRFESEVGELANQTSERREETRKMVRGLLIGIADHGKGASCFPTLHISALCHAANRWNRTRKLDGKTLLDFHHVAAALPYCRVFMTENGMRGFLANRQFQLERDFRCRVVSKPDDAIGAIKEIAEGIR
jgi:hypothetical protein